MFILLFILSLFSQDCLVELDIATVSKTKTSKTSVEKVFFTEGSIQIDDEFFERAVIKYNLTHVDGEYLFSTMVYFDDEQSPRVCNKELLLNYIDDLEKALRCLCEHTHTYYKIQRLFDAYIEYNNQYHERLFR